MNHSNTESPTWNSDPYQHHHHHHLNNYDQETSYDDAINPHKNSHSDEEVILASSRPKKRAGRKKFKETRHPVYRGVRQRNTNKWVCEVREPSKQKRIWLGTYPTAEMAARAHDVAALALRGNTACLNFADSVWRLPVPASNDEKDVRRAAAEAAEAFRPRAVVEEEEGASSSSHFGGDFCMNNNIIDQDFNYYMEKEGVLMSPPPCFQKDYTWDDVETDAEVELWSYSI